MRNNFIYENLKLMEEWNWEKNNSLGFYPEKTCVGSSKNVWWKCKICKHEWQTSPGHRTDKVKPTGCPKCAILIRAKNRKNSLRQKENIKIIYPDILDEWDYARNTILPEHITKGSHEKIWWKCEKNHSWQASVGSKIKGHRCPYCSGRLAVKGVNDLQTINPLLAKEWNYKKNNNLKPEDFLPNSNKKVWWICKNGHEWSASISNRNKKRGCPICSMYRHVSLPEKVIYFYFSKIFTVEENIKINDKMELDLFFPTLNLGIEYDGRAWHKNTDRDIKKDKACKNKNINLIRVREDGLKNYDTNAFIINAQKPESNLKFMEAVIFEILNYINRSYCLNLFIDVNIERDYYSILSIVEKYENENSLSVKFPDLLSEWNYVKNENLKPSMFSSGSSKKVWWICKNGHEWKTSISNRTNNSNRNQCPYCQRKKTDIGVNDILTLKADFLIDWDYERNKISPSNYMQRSGVVVWWKCHKCGFEWQTPIASRAQHGCRFCARKEAWKNRRKKVKNIDTGEVFNSSSDAGLKYNIRSSLINRVCRGERKTAGGYHWEYVLIESE